MTFEQHLHQPATPSNRVKRGATGPSTATGVIATTVGATGATGAMGAMGTTGAMGAVVLALGMWALPLLAYAQPVNSAPKSAAPESSAPNGSAPNGSAPQGTIPQGTIPSGTMPSGTTTQTAATVSAAASAPINSILDDRLMYQLLVAEMALAQGDAGTAYDWLLDAARRTRDEDLFRRSTNVALQARAGDQALLAVDAWRQAYPDSLDALRTQLQILLAMNRPQAMPEPLRLLLALSPVADRSLMINGLPIFLKRAGDPTQVARLMEDVLKPHLAAPATAMASRVALGRAWLDADNVNRSWALLQEAEKLAPPPNGSNAGPTLLALDLMPKVAKAEALVQDYLAKPKAEPGVRLAYVRALARMQRYADAVQQLQVFTAAQPNSAPPYLTLGALHLELKQTDLAEAALKRYVELASQEVIQPNPNLPVPDAEQAQADSLEGPDDDERPDRGLIQAWLMLSQVAEQRGDFNAAETWLARIQDPAAALDVQTRRATLLARQGRIDDARETIRRLPETRPADAKNKLLAEVNMLRDAQRYQDAYTVLAQTQTRFGEEPGLMYEQSMLAEKVNRLDEMESLLRRVIALKPDHAHAHNALGYSLADRNLRLPEALGLIQRALELAPGDPFISDSLGWVQFRMGNLAEAKRVLQGAWTQRPDAEIGAHLGEVLWVLGEKEEARRIWRDAKTRDAKNAVLNEALTRLKVQL